MYVGHHITYALLVYNFVTNWNVLTNFGKNTKHETTQKSAWWKTPW